MGSLFRQRYGSFRYLFLRCMLTIACLCRSIFRLERHSKRANELVMVAMMTSRKRSRRKRAKWRAKKRTTAHHISARRRPEQAVVEGPLALFLVRCEVSVCHDDVDECGFALDIFYISFHVHTARTILYIVACTYKLERFDIYSASVLNFSIACRKVSTSASISRICGNTLLAESQAARQIH